MASIGVIEDGGSLRVGLKMALDGASQPVTDSAAGAAGMAPCLG